MAFSTSYSPSSSLATFTTPTPTSTTATRFPLQTLHFHSSSNSTINTRYLSLKTSHEKWRCGVSFLPSFLKRGKDVATLKQELLQAIDQTDRGADATPQDQLQIDKMTRELEALNPIKDPLKSDLINGKWELLYTTSVSILQTGRPKFLRSRKNYQAINLDTLRAQNMESWPFFNQMFVVGVMIAKGGVEAGAWSSGTTTRQVTADLMPINARKVGVKFDYFKIFGLIPVKAPERAVGQLEITYLDEDLRVSRGDKGNLFILQMLDPSYRVPV